MSILTCKQKEVLKHARKVYGGDQQILVSMEELCELATICSKYPRYIDKKKARKELHQGVLDELADVSIIMEHIKAIFNISNGDLKKRISKKVDRLERWIEHSNNPEYTMEDRAVDSQETKDNWQDEEDTQAQWDEAKELMNPEIQKLYAAVLSKLKE
mgnify:CR=1 FL=1